MTGGPAGPLEGLMVGGVCAGYGGLELATEQMGGTTRWMVEYEPNARKVLRARWPKVKLYRDLRELDWARLAPVDVMVAGFPCQPVSQAGRQKGTADERWIWPYIADGIGVLEPRWVLLENVRGILTANGGAAMGEVLGSLADLGFDAEWCCVRAGEVGACHRRERWFCVARHTDRMAGATTGSW